MSNPKISCADLSVGDARELVVVENLTRTQIVQYAGASGDFNPIHWNGRIAREVQLPDVIAHGMLTMATVARLVTDYHRGLFRENGSVLYVNRGAGVAGPALRINCPREITTIELARISHRVA